MRSRCAPLLALVCCAAAQSCATKLDFDAVASRYGQRDAAQGTQTDAAVLYDADVDAATTPPDLGGGPLPDAQVADSDLADAGPAAQDPASFSCATVTPAPTFCDDFETPNLESRWSELTVLPTSAAGSIAIDGSAARAGQESLLSVINDGGDSATAVVGISFAELSGASRLTVEYDLQLEQIDPTPGRRLVLFQFRFGTDDVGYSQHALEVESQGATVTAGFVEYDTDASTSSDRNPKSSEWDYDFLASTTLRQWSHVTYTLAVDDLSGSNNRVTLSIDDVVLIDAATHFSMTYLAPWMEIGVPWVDTLAFTAQDRIKSWRARFDNVLVRIEPK